MAEIQGIIYESNFERVRSKIAYILAIEFANQKTINQTELAAEQAKPTPDPVKIAALELNISAIPTVVWEERFKRVTPAETINEPIVNVIFLNAPLNDLQTRSTQSGIDKYSIEVFAGAKDKGNDRGDRLSTIKLHRTLGLIRSILMSPHYDNLGFEESDLIIGHRSANNIQIGKPEEGADDADNMIQGRIDFDAKFAENVEQNQSFLLAGNDTTMKLFDTEKGYYWSTDGGGVIPYNLTIGPDNPLQGTTVPLPGVYTYNEGDTEIIHPVPFEGFEFVNWKDQNNNIIPGQDVTINFDGNKTAKAFFQAVLSAIQDVFTTAPVQQGENWYFENQIGTGNLPIIINSGQSNSTRLYLNTALNDFPITELNNVYGDIFFWYKGMMVITNSYPGEAILEWQQPTGQNFIDLETAINAAITYAATKGKTPIFLSMLWQQSESDIILGREATYESSWRTLESSIRAINPTYLTDMIIVDALLSANNGQDPTAKSIINTAKITVASENINTQTMNTDEFTFEDDFHYNTNQYELILNKWFLTFVQPAIVPNNGVIVENVKCANFNGINDTATVPSVTLGDIFEIIIEGQFNTTQSAFATIIGATYLQGGIGLFRPSASVQSLVFAAYPNGAPSSVNVFTIPNFFNGRTKKLKITYNNGLAKAYVNGTKTNEATINHYNGFNTEITIYKLLAPQVGTNYFTKALLSRFCISNNFDYRIKEGQGLKFYDSIGTNDATIVTSNEASLWSGVLDNVEPTELTLGATIYENDSDQSIMPICKETTQLVTGFTRLEYIAPTNGIIRGLSNEYLGILYLDWNTISVDWQTIADETSTNIFNKTELTNRISQVIIKE